MLISCLREQAAAAAAGRRRRRRRARRLGLAHCVTLRPNA
jgi:hypothetical protein